MRNFKKPLRIVLLILVLFSLSVEVFTDGENSDAFRLVGSSSEHWNGNVLQNADGYEAQQMGLFYQAHVQENPDGFRLLPPPARAPQTLVEKAKAEASHWEYYK